MRQSTGVTQQNGAPQAAGQMTADQISRMAGIALQLVQCQAPVHNYL